MFFLYSFLSKILTKRFCAISNNPSRTVVGIALTYKCEENCKFCFAKNLTNFSPSYITVEDFSQTLQWLIKQNFYLIGLTGGEPTNHPQFPEICNILKTALKNNHRLIICLLTKRFGLKNIFDNMAGYKDRFIMQVNLSSDDFDSSEKIENLSSAIYYIKDKRGRLCLRTVLQDENNINFKINAKKIIDFASLHKLSLRFSFDSCMRITEETMGIRAKRTLDFIENCIKKNVRVQSVRSIPACFFNRNQLKKYSKYLLFDCFKGFHKPLPHFYINPDLSSFMCCSAHYRIKDVLKYRTIGELLERYRDYLAGFSFEPVFRRCAKCDKFKERLCFGGCLGHRGGAEKIIDI